MSEQEFQKKFSEITKGTTRHIKAMRQDALFKDGVLSAKIKTMGACLWSIQARCEPCVEFYAKKSKELGVTVDEFGEVLAIANTMGGCVGETWAAKALRHFLGEKKMEAEKTGDGPACIC